MAQANQYSIGEMRHHKVSIIILILAVIVLGAYVLLQTSSGPVSVNNSGVSSDEALRAQALAQLNATSVPPPSAEQINKILSQLSKSKVTLSESQKAEAISQLRNSK